MAKADQANAYRQIQFSLDDELVKIGEGAAGAPTGAGSPSSGSGGDIQLATLLDGSSSPPPIVFEQEMATATVADHTSGNVAALTVTRSTITTKPEPATSADTEAPAETATQTDRVGVVFVHGVGSQPESETVREFSQPLIDWLERWHSARKLESPKVVWSRLSYGTSQQGPAAYAIRIPAYQHHQPRTWFLAEAWWASRLAEPSVGTVLGWALGSYPRLMVALFQNAVHVLRGKHYPRGAARMSRLGRAIGALNVFLVLTGYAIAFFPGQLLILVLSLAASLPIPGFQQFVLLRILQPLLVNNLGDFVVYMHDDVQAVHIRQSVYDAVSWLVREKQCARVVVVAHSQGTVVAFDALSTPEPGGSAGSGPSLERDLQKVTKLITFGAALNRMWQESADAKRAGRLLRAFEHDLKRGEKWTNFYSEFDWAPVGGLRYGSADDQPVTNNLSALSDHGEYFVNHEQFTTRLAQEIDSPADPQASRFWPTTGKITGSERLERNRLHREQRVTTWTLWRSLAWLAVGAIFIYRYGHLGRDIPSDAAAILGAGADVPVLGAIPGFLTLAGGFISAVAGVVPGVQAVAHWIQFALVPVALTGAAIGAVVVVLYLLVLSLLFRPWHRAASLSSADEDPQEWSWWQAGVRTAAYLVTLGVWAYVMAMLPPFGEIGALLTATAP